MPDTEDLAKSWISSLKNRRIIAALVVAATILGGVAGFFSNIQKLVDWAAGWSKRPVIIAFTLSPYSVGFEETQEGLFAAGPKLYRTFGPRYPFADDPVGIFLVTISNPTNRDMIITKVIYDVAEAGEVKGGPEGPLNALAKYAHEILHEPGEQLKEIIPPFRIARESASSLELQIMSASIGPGFGWLLKIGFVSDAGTFYTEQFQLYLPELTADAAAKPRGPPSQPKIHESTEDLLNRRVMNIKHPTPMYRDCIFRKAGILGSVEKLDAVDKTVMFQRAAYNTIADFRDKKTTTQAAISYSDLITLDQTKLLLTLVKSFAAC